MTQGILNPVDLSLPLLPAEQEFARCLKEGNPCLVGNGERPAPDNRVESGDTANVVRGEVIRFFAFGGDSDKCPVRGSIIGLQGAWISGGLDLEHANIPYALLFGHCHFADSVVMRYAECVALTLSGSHLVKGLNADGLTTKGGVNLRGGFSADGEVRLLGASIGGDLTCVGGEFRNPKGGALVADGLTAKGSVHLCDGFSADGEVRLLGASIGGNLTCVGGEFRNPKGGALVADGLTAKGNVHLRDGFSADGEVRLLDANIGGNLECGGGEFHNPKGRALTADRMMAKGSVHLRDGFSADGGVRLPGADIGGNLECDGGKFKNTDGPALSADGISATGSVFLRNRFSAEGEVRLLDANIGGNLECGGGEFHNPKGNALNANGLTTKGGVLLRAGFSLCAGFSADGEVRLLGANIGGNLDCGGGNFHNPSDYDSREHKKYALNAERMETGGHVYLNALVNPGGEKLQFSAHGRVRFANATIGGNFNCKGGQFLHSGKGSALAAGGLKSRGAVFLSEGFTARGEVALHVARIGNFVCAGCKPNDKSPTVVNLSSTKAVAVDDDEQSWEPFQFLLDDFTYDAFFGANTPKDESRRRWLAKRPKEMPSKDGEPVKVLFSPLPYEQAAKVMFGMGHARDARDILLEKERRQTADERTKQPRKFLRQLWDVFAGYGYRLRYTAAWMAGFVLAGAGFFGAAAHHDQIVPHQPAILASEKYQAALGGNTPMAAARAAFPAEYPEFTPLAYSLDVFIPLFALHQEPFWSPAAGGRDDLWKSSLLLALFLAGMSALAGMTWFFADWIRRETGGDFAGARSAGFGMAVVSLLLGFALASGFAYAVLDCDIPHWLADWRWLTVWYWLEIGFGWILTSLFLLSVTGVLRPRQSSGEKG